MGLISELEGLAGSYLTGGVTVQVKSNYTPAITVYTGSTGGSSSGGSSSGGAPSGNLFSRLIGLKAGVEVLDSSGNVVASYGDWPPTDWVRVIAALAVIGMLGILTVKVIRSVGR